MTTAELTKQLVEEGCNPANYAINTRGSDVFCLLNDGLQWSVFYSERGDDQSPIFTSPSESEACFFYLSFMRKVRQDHCVGFLKSEAAANELQIKLQQLGLTVIADQIPYRGPHDPRYRVFVVGKDVFAARKLLGEIPLRDEA